ncbi:MAG: hypothetical protein ABIR55_15810 [Burkholderiaceae bacterium]
MAACSVTSTDAPPVATAPVPVPAPGAAAPPASPPVPPAVVIPPVAQLPAVSNATTERAYRRDGATHIYAHNAARIYKGMLKPMLYAIGVVDVWIDRQGRVTRIDWRRAPRHAPEVMAEIERTIRQAAPFPVPVRMGRVVYSDIWLWDKSGQFQLDTLTEGQM